MTNNNQNFLCCDPGSGGTGFAMFSSNDLYPIATKKIEIDISNWWLKRKLLLFKTEEYLQTIKDKCFVMYIEKPQFMESHTGLTAARTDSLVKLVSIYACIIYIAEKNGFDVRVVSINAWKGQMSKEMITIRIQKILNKRFVDHVADAVGIGLYLKGKLHKVTT